MTLHEEVIKAFGQVSVNFSELEETLVYQTAKLISPNDTDIGYVTLAGLQFMTVEKIFRALVIKRTSSRYSKARPSMQGREAEIHERMKAAMNRIAKVRADRNRYIHSHWNPAYVFDEASEDYIESGEAHLTRHQMDEQRGHVVHTSTLAVAEISSLAAEIEQAMFTLVDFIAWTDSFLRPADALFPKEEGFQPT